MDKDPFLVLGIESDSSDEDIKQRYLALVRQFSPERDPERFQDIRTAFEAVRDHRGRLATRLLKPGQAGVAQLKRSLLGDATNPERAPRDVVNAVLVEGLTASMQRQLAAAQGERSGG